MRRRLVYIPHMAVSRALSCTGNWSVKRRQFSSPTWFLKPCRILVNISFRSSLGFDHDATASQKNMKSGTTPPGLTWIIWQMPRNAESFSSLSRMFRNDEHPRVNFCCNQNFDQLYFIVADISISAKIDLDGSLTVDDIRCGLCQWQLFLQSYLLIARQKHVWNIRLTTVV